MAKIENTLPPILTGGTSIHDDLSGLNVGEYIHLTATEKTKFDSLPNTFAPVDAEKNVNTDWNAISGDEQLLNKPLTFPPSTHTHVEADITDLDKYTQLEVDNLLNDKVDKVAGKSLIDDTEITRLASVTNFDNSGNVTALGNKVDKIVGKGLSEEDYTTVEKSKLAGIEVGATANDTDVNLKNRANHTGTQLTSTISDFVSQVGTLITNALASFKTANFLDFTSSGQTQLNSKSATIISSTTQVNNIAVATEQYMQGYPILANTIPDNCVLNLLVKFFKAAGGGFTLTCRVYINTTNSLVGATLIAQTTAGGAAVSDATLYRNIIIRGSNLIILSTSSTLNNDLASVLSSTPSTISFDRSVNQFLIVSFTVPNSSINNLNSVNLTKL